MKLMVLTVSLLLKSLRHKYYERYVLSAISKWWFYMYIVVVIGNIKSPVATPTSYVCPSIPSAQYENGWTDQSHFFHIKVLICFWCTPNLVASCQPSPPKISVSKMHIRVVRFLKISRGWYPRTPSGRGATPSRTHPQHGLRRHRRLRPCRSRFARPTPSISKSWLRHWGNQTIIIVFTNV
jgi:hypothetical protein